MVTFSMVYRLIDGKMLNRWIILSFRTDLGCLANANIAVTGREAFPFWKTKSFAVLDAIRVIKTIAEY